MKLSDLILTGAPNKLFRSPLLYAALAATAVTAQPAQAQSSDMDDIRPVAEHFEVGERMRIARERITREEGDEMKTRKEKIYVTYNGRELREDCAPMEHFTLEAERKVRTEEDRRRRWRVVETQQRYVPASLTDEVRAEVEQCLAERRQTSEAQIQGEFRAQAARQALGIAMDVDQVADVQQDANGNVRLNVSIDFRPQ